jgi:serine/threonine protein kinase
MKKARIVKQGQLLHIQNEIRILSRIRCPFVIELKAVFQDENSLYLMFDYISGGELYSHLRKDQKFELPIYQFYSVEIACAIHHLHKLGIIYRDLKPENICLNKIGHIRLVEFSLAKIIGNTTNRTFTLCGTPEYVSPEIINGQGYGFSADWWAFGILLHEMSVGYPPFNGSNPFIVYRKILEGKLEFDKKFHRPTKHAIRSLLTSDITQRIGCGNFDQIKNHSFYKGVDWNSAFQELIVPLKVPTVLSDGDTSNYDFYPEEVLEEPANLTQEERNMFSSIDEILDRGKQI